jgi:hypothetical protein
MRTREYKHVRHRSTKEMGLCATKVGVLFHEFP